VQAEIVITNAFLNMPVDKNRDAGYTHYIKKVLGSWSETGVTWGNRPSLSLASLDAGSRITGGDGSVRMQFQIPTSLVRDWFDGSESNYGLWIEDGFTGGYPGTPTVTVFWPRQHSADPPEVEIWWHYSGESTTYVSRFPLDKDATISPADDNWNGQSISQSGWASSTERMLTLLHFTIDLP
jgi:hypothetical protein